MCASPAGKSAAERLFFGADCHRCRPSNTPTSAATASVPKIVDLEPVRIMLTAASTASSLAPATRVENRCARTSKIDAFGGGEGRRADNAAGTGWGGGGGRGGNPA